MKQKAILTLIICSSSLLAGCNTTFNNPFNAHGPMVVSAKHSNSDIISDLIVLNKNEIAASRLAESRTTNHEVRHLAKEMVHAHTKNLEQTLRLSKKIHAHQEVNNVSSHLQNEGAKEREILKGLNGSAFDKHYVNAMIRDHEEALRLIDHTLMTHSTNPLLTKHLEATRQHVMMHLEQFRAAHKQLRG